MRTGAVQLNATEDTDRNLETADRLVREAAGLGAELVVLPEKWSVLGTGDQIAAGAQPLHGTCITWAREVSRELGIDVVAGSIAELREGRDKTSNTSVHADPAGEIRGIYRKLHMFDVEVDGTVYAESEREEPGDEAIVSWLAGGKGVGLSICYDVRFPELYQALAAEGAEVITVPAAFTLATTRDHWELLLRARAVETQSFVIGANQIGAHPGGFRSGGRSMIVDPWGLVLATAADQETVIVADLDFSLLRDIRRRLPSLTHRRPEAYRASARAEV
jgi:deaminated glutathione amidase